MSRDIWYPLSKPEDERITIRKAEGIYLYDNRGKRYMDANSGLWNVPLGYSNLAVRQQVAEQLQQVSYVNACEFGNDASLELADLLKELHHKGISKMIYTCTGSEAVEVAIKLIRKYASLGSNPQKREIAIIKNSYHGSYYGSMSCSDYDGQERAGYGPLISGIRELSMPFCTCCRSGQASEECTRRMKERLEGELQECKENLAGIILEPVLGSAGVIPLPEWYIKRIEEFAGENDVLTVFDEVATGFGRTGSMFCYQQYGVEPDMITMSKGINNGMLPMGAVAVSEKIAERFQNKNELIFHLSTQNGNALCCAAAIATLGELQKNNQELIQQAQKRGSYFKDKFEKEILTQFAQVFDLRCQGMMFAIELSDKDTKNRMKFAELLKLVELLKKNGVILEWSYIEKVTSCLVLFLPFIIEECEIDELLEKLKKSFRKLIS